MSEKSISEILSSEADEIIIDNETVEETVVTEEIETVEEVTAPTAEIEPVQELNVNSEIEGFKQAAISERKKRQALQAQIDNMNQANQVEKPDAYMAPDEAIAFANTQLSNDFNAKLLNMSEAQAKTRHSDFDAMSDVFFNELAASNPALAQQAMQQPDPYEFVYQQAKNHSEFSGITSMSDYRSKIEAEIMAKIKLENESNATIAANKAINDALPVSLAGTTAIGGNVELQPSHRSIDDILK